MTRLARVGYENVVGWLEGGMDAWRKAGGEVQTVPQVPPTALRALLDSGLRAEGAGRAHGRGVGGGAHRGALHVPLNELRDRLAEVPREPLFVLCGSGYRSSIGCSLLQRAGRRDVTNVIGGWTAWEASEQTAQAAADAARMSTS